MADWPLQDAKNKFSALVNAALAANPSVLPGGDSPQLSSWQRKSTTGFAAWRRLTPLHWRTTA